jgi:hypothetical protein
VTLFDMVDTRYGQSSGATGYHRIQGRVPPSTGGTELKLPQNIACYIVRGATD